MWENHFLPVLQLMIWYFWYQGLRKFNGFSNFQRFCFLDSMWENTIDTFWFPEDGMRKAEDHLSFLHCRGVRGQKQSKKQIFLPQNMHWYFSICICVCVFVYLYLYMCYHVWEQKQSKKQIFLSWNMHQLMSTLREYWNIFDQICKLSQKSLPKYPLYWMETNIFII